MGRKICDGHSDFESFLMKVLVTGGSGFIGRRCIMQLVNKGYEVHAFSSSNRISTSEVKWYQVDLLDTMRVRTIVRDIKPSHLIHFAWFTKPGVYWNSSENLKWVQASFSLIQAFAEYNGKRFLAAGTCAEYDWSHELCNEFETPCRPSTLYGAAKLSTSLLLDAWSKDVGLSCAWGRIFSLYGPQEDLSRVVGYVTSSLLCDEPALCTQGEQVRDFMYVEDVAAGFVALLESEITGAINIASGKGISLKSLILEIAHRLGKQDLVRFGAVPSRLDEPTKLIADVSRLKKELNFKPNFSLEMGIELVIEDMKKILDKNL